MKNLKKLFYLGKNCLGGEELREPGNFVLPKLNRCFFIRLTILALITYIFFGFIAVPTLVKGSSMEPTYQRIGFNFCWRPTYWFSTPKRGDIVIIRYTSKTLYLKRVVALAGDRVAFLDGKLYVNGLCVQEPYVKKTSHWMLPEKIVQPGKIYVVGDNRSMPIYRHKFGQVLIKRLYGAPLW
jgi:signal peptidase I